MCEPMTIATAAIAVAGAVYGTVQQKKAAEKQEKFYRAAQAEEQKQITASKSIEAQDRTQRARVERARLRAASAESGLTGITTDDLLDDIDFQAGRDVARTRLGTEFAQTNSNFQLQSNLNRIDQPDYIGTALNTGLQVMNIANSAPQKPQQPTQPTTP